MKKLHLSPYLLVILSFLGGILIGGFLLTLPIARVDNNWGTYEDGVFMATSAVCVTGFDCYQAGLGNTLTYFGKVVEMVLIQIGGLGFVTVLTFIVTLFRGKIAFKDRYYLSQATSSTSIAHVIAFVRKIFLATIAIELIGFGLMIPAFLDMRGNTTDAYFNCAFHAVSAFNNAGLDLFGGGTSFIRTNPLLAGMSDWAYYYLLSVTMILIILGALSYIAILEIFSFKKKPRQWSAHTKICVLMTFILIVGGTLFLFLTNCLIHPENGMNLFDCLFLSVSSRTAGFATVDMNLLSTGGRVINWMLMFIGGGPLGTASGIKTTTIFIIIVTIYSFMRGRKVTAFHRTYSQSLIVKAMAVMLTSIFIVIIGYVAVSMFEINNPDLTGEKAIYETISAFSNTGLSMGLPTTLSIGGKITYVVLMFVGRLGPMTMFSVFSTNMHIDEDKTHVNYVEEDILIG